MGLITIYIKLTFHTKVHQKITNKLEILWIEILLSNAEVISINLRVKASILHDNYSEIEFTKKVLLCTLCRKIFVKIRALASWSKLFQLFCQQWYCLKFYNIFKQWNTILQFGESSMLCCTFPLFGITKISIQLYYKRWIHNVSEMDE